MHPWVARQWHAWGCSRSVSGDLCRRQRFRGPVNLHFHTQSSAQPGAKKLFRNVNSAIIVPSSVTNTRPEDLIVHIKPVLRQRVFKDRFIVFFVTPSFATWLLDDQVFLHKALQRTYAHLLDRTETPYAQVHALCAVVDKLPISRPVGNVDNIEEEVRQRIQDPNVQEIGQEGIAYAALSPSDSLPTSSGVGTDKAAISFVTFERSDDDGGHFSDTVRLPLANTVFQTGSPTMMTYSTWEKAKGSHEFTLKEKRNISHHGIRMKVESDIQSTVLSVPLVPLSKPREVEASMGNILRRITGPHGASITASQELEQQVPRYFSTRGEPSQATTVWALVMGPHRNVDSSEETSLSLQDQSEEKQWENLWKQDPPCWSPLVPVALKNGARLHRVLSGGGGWGKKAGLLSLDPIPTRGINFADELSDPEEILEGNFEENFGEEGPDLDSALQQVARPGDWVQFFISPSVPAKDDFITGSHGGEQVWGLELGTIPSTTDAMPVALGETGTAGRKEISVYKSTFGGLAEGGMVISRRFKLGQEDGFSTVGTSTVDVPFSRFSVLNWRTESSSEDDVDVGGQDK
ncbi:6-phosphogluconate dehydrogenase [Paraphaeosphaeria sporulosa]